MFFAIFWEFFATFLLPFYSVFGGVFTIFHPSGHRYLLEKSPLDGVWEMW